MRIAILGGTFDPIHNGHLKAAQTVAEAFDIDEVHFVPAFAPPHKARLDLASVFHRFAMVALATADFKRYRVSTVEVDTLAPRYSVDTLEQMHASFPGASFLFITGTDMYREIEEWKNYRKLFQLTSLAIVQRPGFPMRTDIADFKQIGRGVKAQIPKEPEVYYFPDLREEISSTRIRKEARMGRKLGHWLPESVESYITRNAVYQDA